MSLHLPTGEAVATSKGIVSHQGLLSLLLRAYVEDDYETDPGRCGHEFGDYRSNWKLAALIHVRDTPKKLHDVYRGTEQPDPTWIQLREYTCPGCGSQLEVEAVPRGCPPDFEVLPDLDTFYRDWLGRPLPDEVEFKDTTLDTVTGWKE